MHTHDASLWMLLLLGAVHGLNPAMGWLFAVSLGLQEERRSAVWRALGPLALGHALAIGAVVAVAAALQRVVPVGTLKWAAAALLLAFGLAHLRRHRHPRIGGMRVRARELTLWSFLVASAHGAGLMVIPLVLGRSVSGMESGAAAAQLHHHAGTGTGGAGGGVALAALGGVDLTALLATLVHTAGYVLVAAALALLVYEWLGLRLLRTAWVNLDLVWALALIATALLTPWI